MSSFLSINHPQIAELLIFAQEQGEYAERMRNSNNLIIQRKQDGSLVTSVDLAISEAALRELPLIIDAPVISEESPSLTEEHDLFWLIDPIDGTNSYINKYDGYAIAIALIDKGCPVMSVVVAPALKISYCATIGEGAFKISHDLEAVSQLGFDYIGKPLFASFYKRSNHHTKKMESFLLNNNMGMKQVYPESSLLKYCFVAEGIYAIGGGWHDLCSWDIAAADLIVEESGGRMFSASDNKRFIYSSCDSYVESPLAVARGVELRC